MSAQDVVVSGWPAPRGYSNGRVGHGEPLHVAGQIGWTADGAFPDATLLGQFARALDNVLAVVRAAGGAATDIAAMTVYVTDIAGYRAIRRELGPIWRARMGTHYPAMALVGVAALVETSALVEISAVAYVERAP
jgi:enamine deaminase RidA (YjgF/YER057c/UK114 family)